MCSTEFKKFEPLSENSSPHLVSQAGYGPALSWWASRSFIRPCLHA